MFYVKSIYVYVYKYRDSITDHVQINSICREASCWTFSVFKGDYYALSFLFLYEGTYIRGLDTIRFVLRLGVRCDFGLFTV